MPDHFYVYPAYLGRQLSRRAGRRLPADQAVPDVTADEILQAAKRLGFKAEVETDKQYPRRFFVYEGRLKVTKKPGTTKVAFLKAVAADVRKHRPAGAKK
ncbi:MAG TPA: signal recognition particle subunit SRP19/SEC65 family protein [Thermoplasmata archaeon]|nr:signal recognition particle subunit SRP19/SEC65 family protein [Thermoplasmata archaeon]